MNLYTTEITAINPMDGELTKYAGPNVPGISFKDARMYCQKNGLGYCFVNGLLIAEIPVNDIGNPDWNNKIDYENTRLN